MKEEDNNPEQISPRITEDGSHTLFSERFHQHYHSTEGAVTESRHVFFRQNGLKEALQARERINILEIGFGTGLNLLLLMDHYLHLKSKAEVRYYGIEAFPVRPKLIKELNYGDYLYQPKLMEKLPPVFNHPEKGINKFCFEKGIKLYLFNGFLDDFVPGDCRFDYIFHDAFSPEANPEVWDASTFRRLFASSKPDAILTTYCAASKVRGAMASAGWKVARAEGAPGKREMTIASPSENPLKEFKRVNEKRLAQRYEQNDF
jgi:tRNA U34 5-methylaminomethyl-2-thiouridine-forming methyltransferase MnmC